MLLAGSQLDTETLWILSSLETRPADGQTTHVGSHCGPDDTGHFYSKPCWQTYTSLFKMMSKDFIWLLLPIAVITLWSSYDIGILHPAEESVFWRCGCFCSESKSGFHYMRMRKTPLESRRESSTAITDLVFEWKGVGLFFFRRGCFITSVCVLLLSS